VLSELNESALIRILTEPKNALVKQYRKLFKIDGIELEFEEAAIEIIAQKALERKTGARGLRAIMEETLGGLMFNAPSRAGLERVIITKKFVQYCT
jgi:ATP-dependent Clp protease ATP-binding subunit ClpX